MARFARLLHTLLPILRTFPLPLIHRVSWQLFLLRRGALVHKDRFHTLERRALPEEERLQRLDQVLGEMEAIRHLCSRRRSSARGFGVPTTSVPADDLGTSMLFEPGNHGLRLSIWQKIDDPMALQIDQDRSVAVTTPEGKVIDAQHPWRLLPGDGGGTDRA
jgi:hypothetical protein